MHVQDTLIEVEEMHFLNSSVLGAHPRHSNGRNESIGYSWEIEFAPFLPVKKQDSLPPAGISPLKPPKEVFFVFITFPPHYIVF